MNKKEYKPPRQVFCVRINEEIKQCGEPRLLFTGVIDPHNMDPPLAEMKKNLESCEPDDVLFVSPEVGPRLVLLITAAVLVKNNHGHVNYIYREPLWNTLLEGQL